MRATSPALRVAGSTEEGLWQILNGSPPEVELLGSIQDPIRQYGSVMILKAPACSHSIDVATTHRPGTPCEEALLYFSCSLQAEEDQSMQVLFCCFEHLG
mmetsp:Transcript_72675/g.151699  ORF Transcript_72675/g.151699 Transcript_72675/m.151699 type:complete len:100 (+) Transcript_72675:1497-1796(+)